MNYPPKTFGRRHAFTLIELLVVIAIIAVLAALLMPALRSMQQKAGATKCLANMKTIGAGVALFTAEHDGQFPRGGWSDTGAVLDPPVESSTRRHASRGAWRTSLQNGLFIVLYKCGLSPRHLHRWYYRDRASTPGESTLVAQPVEEFSRR